MCLLYLIINKTLVQNTDREKKTNMASNIHSHQHLTGPAALMAGGTTLKFRDPR